MVRRGFGRLIAAAAVGCLILLLVTSAEATVGPSSAGPSSLQAAGAPGLTERNGRQAAALTGCERRLQPARRPGVPVVAIVGASITAGVGAGDPAGSWAVLLARQLHWNAFVYGVPGASYVHSGLGQKGPVAAEIARAHLRALQPALVIVQVGHDDMSVPPALERYRVEQTIARIKAEAPQARIALLTAFAGRSRPPALYRIDQAIVAGGKAGFGQAGLGGQQLGVELQAGQRGAQLVAGVADQLPLSGQRPLQRAEHGVERRGQPAEPVGAVHLDPAARVPGRRHVFGDRRQPADRRQPGARHAPAGQRGQPDPDHAEQGQGRADAGHLLVHGGERHGQLHGQARRERRGVNHGPDPAGRSDDVINRGGEKIYPREIEEFLLTQPGVRSAAVVAASDEVLGQRPVAYVIPAMDPAGPDLADTLRQACSAALPRPKVPTEFCLVPELPLGATGKVSRRQLRELAAAPA